MYFYISFLLCNFVMCVISKDLLLSSRLEKVDPTGIGLKFVTKVNNTSTKDYNVELYPFECCLHENDENCDIFLMIGGSKAKVGGVFVVKAETEIHNVVLEIQPGNRQMDAWIDGKSKSFLLIVPTTNPYNRRGRCTIYLDYRSTTGSRILKRETTTTRFDTTIKAKDAKEDLKICKHVDEDPLNNCRPVDCESYYNGMKPYYDKKKKRCTKAPVCIGDFVEELPKVIYNPISNDCMKGEATTVNDKRVVRELHRHKKEHVIVIIENDGNDTTDGNEEMIAENENFKVLNNEVGTTTNAVSTKITMIKTTAAYTTRKTKLINMSFCRYLEPSRYSSTALSVIIGTQCFLICAIVYCTLITCRRNRKKVISQYFNKNNDASCTTPLICASNIDTDTTDYQYVSESSNNIDKKIKCYKACQKERKHNIKTSLSDDILSKCLNRRNWDRIPKSNTIPEAKYEDVLTIENERKPEIKKPSHASVKFEDQERVQHDIVKNLVEKIQCTNQNTVASEKEIKCHSFNAESKPSSDDKSAEKPSLESEKGAQAYFSNDSIDDFLSERAFMYAGENLSKYSFSSVSSDVKSNFSTRSSRTSKINIVKNVLSLLSRKSKGPSSDPGIKKSGGKLNLELIHMSRASVCSSSNGECVKTLKMAKDSRTSL